MTTGVPFHLNEDDGSKSSFNEKIRLVRISDRFNEEKPALVVVDFLLFPSKNVFINLILIVNKFVNKKINYGKNNRNST
jgi:hypothetical protein